MPDQVLSLLSGQLEPVTTLAQTLQTYGAWGLSAILMVALYFTARSYVTARDKRDTENQEQIKAAFSMVEECAKTAVEQKNATVLAADALRELARRLENVEKKLE
jgi:hypothetical protein